MTTLKVGSPAGIKTLAVTALGPDVIETTQGATFPTVAHANKNAVPGSGCFGVGLAEERNVGAVADLAGPSRDGEQLHSRLQIGGKAGVGQRRGGRAADQLIPDSASRRSGW